MPVISNEALDDPLILDGNESFSGGQFSASRDNLLPPNSYDIGKNIDIDPFGNASTRRGAMLEVGYLVWEDVAVNWESEITLWEGLVPPVVSCVYFDTGANEYIIVADGDDYLKAITEVGRITPVTAATYTGSNVRFAQLGQRMYYTDENAALRYIDSSLADQSIVAGKVSDIKITNKGATYTSPPTVTIDAPTSGVTATATANLGFGGKVISVTITNAGSGYAGETPLAVFGAASSGETDDLAAGTVRLTQTPSKPKMIVLHKNRLFATSADTAIPVDLLYVSDVIDGESWDLAANQIIVGDDGDPITALMPWQDNNMLIFKERSIYMVDADPEKEPFEWAITLINNRTGCVSDKTVQQVGADVFFLTRMGVQSIQSIQAGTRTDVSTPISTPIEDYMGQINQDALSTCCATFWKNRYFLAAPLGSATTPDHVFVFNKQADGWCGLWTGWEPRVFVVTAFGGQLKMNWGDQQGWFFTWADAAVESETTAVDYEDNGVIYESYIITRAYRYGEVWGDKIGYSVQFNLENNHATTVPGNFYYYKDLSDTPQTLEASVTLPANTSLIRKGYNLLSKGRFNQLQFKVQADSGRLALHSVQTSAFAQPITPEI
jgi:hypothetical protein